MARSGAAGREMADAHAHIPDIIARIKDSYAALRPAEQSVADTVLADVQAAVSASNAETARRAGVSEPTVTRFCRAIGCAGVRDFKLQLARSLVVGTLYLDQPETPPQAGTPPFWNSILGEARAALREVEAQLDPTLVAEAAEAIAGAGRVVSVGLGGSSSALAEEIQYRLCRYGVGIAATRDPYLARMIAATYRPGDVVIAVSGTGRTREIVETIGIARHYGARTIAVTAPGSALAEAAEIALTVAVPEYPDTLTPSAARIAFLTVIDLMSAATGYRMGARARENLRRIKYSVLTHRPGAVLEPLGD